MDPVPDTVRAGLVLTALRRAVADKDMLVRAEACIALGRIGSVPNKGGDLVTRELLGVLDRTRGRTKRALLVRRSAMLGLGISGLDPGCARLMKLAEEAEPEDRAYAALALGLARHKPAIPLLARMLPRSVKLNPKTEQVAAIYALGLFGPAPPEEEMRKHKVPMRLSRMATPWAKAHLGAPAVTALARLRLGHKTVVKACGSKSMPIRWAALLGLAYYTAPDAAKDATKVLASHAGMKSGDTQTRVFAMLAAGDLARKLDGSSRVRKSLLKSLRELLQNNQTAISSAAAIALGVARDRTAIGDIAAIIAKKSDDVLLGGCFLALGLLGAHKQATLLDDATIASTRHAGHARGYGALGLALTGDTTRVGRLVLFQKRAFTDRYARRQSPLAIGVLGDKAEVEQLVALVSSQRRRRDREMASSAAYALGWIRGLRAVRPLAELAMTHKDRNVRGMAVIALGYVAARDRHHPLQRLMANMNHRQAYGWRVLKAIAAIL